MTYVDLENKPNTINVGSQLMTFQSSIPKPEGYIAKDAIYKVLQQLEEDGFDINEVSNNLVQERIKEIYDFDENPKTISAYKSQFKKAHQFRPSNTLASEEDIAKCIRINKKLEPILSKMLAEMTYDKEALKAIINVTLDTIMEDRMDDWI
jgi:hypothetical protein